MAHASKFNHFLLTDQFGRPEALDAATKRNIFSDRSVGSVYIYYKDGHSEVTAMACS